MPAKTSGAPFRRMSRNFQALAGASLQNRWRETVHAFAAWPGMVHNRDMPLITL
ncbi:hypothetical protein K227x_15490 [Rubripirellula lacrimiformis]|uniref:Uncharacterized protein n=1 Tax=Rubripirellula lacrimiformis TaxID=1930273 RepID=A0A517N7Q0_9BACT|nr:hypothetical protein K227x_15490 [Rubripirellula lacrimiformis]